MMEEGKIWLCKYFRATCLPLLPGAGEVIGRYVFRMKIDSQLEDPLTPSPNTGMGMGRECGDSIH